MVKFEALTREYQVGVVSCVMDNECIKNVYVHPVTLQLVWKRESYMIDVNMFAEQFSNYKNHNLTSEDIEELAEEVSLWNWDTVVLPDVHTLKVFSNCTGNRSDYGGCGGLGLLKYDFKFTIKNDQGIDLRDFTEACYRMKGSKYDYWYELFDDLNIVENKENEITVEVLFDYGS